MYFRCVGLAVDAGGYKLVTWESIPCQTCSPGFLCVRVAASPIGHPSTWSSCSAWGSKYACTVSLLSMFFSSSNASVCSFSHSNFPFSSSPSLQTAFCYLLASMNRALYLTVHKNELSSTAFLGRPADLIACTLQGSGDTPSFENIKP